MTEQNLTTETSELDDTEGQIMRKADETADDTEGHGRYVPADDRAGGLAVSDNEDDSEGHSIRRSKRESNPMTEVRLGRR